ncbi:acyl-CoA dehydrogenase [Brevibacterium sp. UCMA 11754]|uniref:acyl-CoA dehydrogenase n=1 Tax=Brevibacterium sp. UCMA 11754 TaxID=2749198 RepID=UPI001F436DF6|nr:acyl-CoA dehydrogenase [Brevibacterium sp. UCMA 11754]MCF2571118.1 acyl-CoA dehydrogenase [Brevibacterium sp. UCMA 11754]
MYRPPVEDYAFYLENIIEGQAVLDDLGHEEMSLADLVDVLAHAGEFSTSVIHPLNAPADREGVGLAAGAVTSSSGFADAYRTFIEAGWPALAAPIDAGGDGLPHIITHPIDEFWSAGGAAFGLIPALTRGAVTALHAVGDDALKAWLLPAMVSGRWTGTMNLTEPQAGTDLSAVRTMAESNSDGTWSIKGQKIFITWGDHDLADNIVHLVLARTPEAPEGHGGLSLFAVPKYLPSPDAVPGERNGISTVSVERKLGLHGSATCVLDYDGATGYLVGRLHAGLESMFVMMNVSRIGVGVQSVGVADRAYQMARDYAHERVQGTPLERSQGAPIAEHPDVGRRLTSMASRISAMRALTVQVSAWIDASSGSDEAQKFADFFSPVVKGWMSESAVEITSDAVQVHGGSGYIEETGIAQYYRDARILPIYEGTTAIQANDLIGRKILRDRGVLARRVLDRIARDVEPLRDNQDSVAARTAGQLESAVATMGKAVEALVAVGEQHPRDAFAASVPMLLAWGDLAGMWMHARITAASVAHPDSQSHRRLREAEFFGTHHLGCRLGNLVEIIEIGEIT